MFSCSSLCMCNHTFRHSGWKYKVKANIRKNLCLGEPLSYQVAPDVVMGKTCDHLCKCLAIPLQSY